jgi:hypothetical protein
MKGRQSLTQALQVLAWRCWWQAPLRQATKQPSKGCRRVATSVIGDVSNLQLGGQDDAGNGDGRSRAGQIRGWSNPERSGRRARTFCCAASSLWLLGGVVGTSSAVRLPKIATGLCKPVLSSAVPVVWCGLQWTALAAGPLRICQTVA